MRRLIQTGILGFLATALLAQTSAVGRGVNFYSLEKERALGNGLADDVRRSVTVLHDPLVNDYVQLIGDRLARSFGDSAPAFTIQTIVSRKAGGSGEPIALPGGHVFVRSSLFDLARNEDEFAEMFAHAMAHVVARHGTRQATRGQMVNLSTIPLIFVGGWTALNEDAADVLVPLGFLKFQRDFELEADKIAARAMATAGFEPEALATYLTRVQHAVPDEKQQYSRWPPLDARLTAIREAVQGPRSVPSRDDSDFLQIQAFVRQLAPGAVISPRRAPALR